MSITMDEFVVDDGQTLPIRNPWSKILWDIFSVFDRYRHTLATVSMPSRILGWKVDRLHGKICLQSRGVCFLSSPGRQLLDLLEGHTQLLREWVEGQRQKKPFRIFAVDHANLSHPWVCCSVREELSKCCGNILYHSTMD